MIVNRQTGEIICTAHAEGKSHDFKLYEESIGSGVSEEIKVQGDSGYQGILKLHKNSETPKKKPKGGELTAAEKHENRRISRERILIENHQCEDQSVQNYFKQIPQSAQTFRITHVTYLRHYQL